MPIPALTSGLLPMGIHVATIAEIKATFGSANDRRIELCEKFERFLAFAATFGAFDAFFVDGSFVTDKPVPNDVDGVLFYRRPDGLSRLLLKPNHLEIINQPRIKAEYKVDLYFADDMTYGIFGTFQALRTEDALQRKLGPDQKKGILKVSL